MEFACLKRCRKTLNLIVVLDGLRAGLGGLHATLVASVSEASGTTAVSFPDCNLRPPQILDRFQELDDLNLSLMAEPECDLSYYRD